MRMLLSATMNAKPEESIPPLWAEFRICSISSFADMDTRPATDTHAVLVRSNWRFLMLEWKFYVHMAHEWWVKIQKQLLLAFDYFWCTGIFGCCCWGHGRTNRQKERKSRERERERYCFSRQKIQNDVVCQSVRQKGWNAFSSSFLFWCDTCQIILMKDGLF